MIKRSLTFLVLSVFLAIVQSCTAPANKDQEEQKNDPVKSIGCPELKAFPHVYSYKTPALLNDLRAKGTKALTKEEVAIYFKHIAAPSELNNPGYNMSLCAIHKILYPDASLVAFLLKENTESSSPELDQLYLVLYNKEGIPVDVMSTQLVDPFITREIKFLSSTEFEIINTDDEYSPDPESEAQDIKNGYESQPDINIQHFRIDPSLPKFQKLTENI